MVEMTFLWRIEHRVSSGKDIELLHPADTVPGAEESPFLCVAAEA